MCRDLTHKIDAVKPDRAETDRFRTEPPRVRQLLGSIQMITDVSIDPAGNVWAANNWNSLEAASSENPSRPTSTWGGGSGFTVIYGVAAPVKPPRIGKVRSY